MIWRSARQRAVDAAVAPNAQWRYECAAVDAAYREWIAASASSEQVAFDTYSAALDREENAAKPYAKTMGASANLPRSLWRVRSRRSSRHRRGTPWSGDPGVDPGL